MFLGDISMMEKWGRVRADTRQGVGEGGAHEVVRGGAHAMQRLIGRLEHTAANTRRKQVRVDIVHCHLHSIRNWT